MKRLSGRAFFLGTIFGFLVCGLVGRLWSPSNRYENFFRIHPYLEQETSYFPTSSQLAATARAQCPPENGKTLVVLGGNSVFNGSGQKKSELWSRELQSDLGDAYHVINFSAPGAGVVDNGAVVFEMLSRDYPRALFVSNTEPGYYPPAESSPYFYLYWDAYYKGLLLDDAARTARAESATAESDWQDFKIGRWLNSLFYFNDLWTGVAYQYGSTVWTSWLKGRSFHARGRLPDWYDKRRVVEPDIRNFEKMLPGHLDVLRRRKTISPELFYAANDGAWTRTEKSLREDRDRIAALLPAPLVSRSLIVLTPYNPWFLERLTDEEKNRVALSFSTGVTLLGEGGFHVLSTFDRGFEPTDFGDTVHLSPSGGRRLARLVAEAVRSMPADARPKSVP